MNWWKNLSVSGKLYTVVGTMGFLIAMELFTLIFAMNTLSSVRAFVAGESFWTKAHKDATSALQNYVVTRDDKYYQLFLTRIKVPLGDRRARQEMQKEDMDVGIATQGLLEGKNHINDIPGVIKLFRRFSWVSILQSAVQDWIAADRRLDQLIGTGEVLNQKINDGSYSEEQVRQFLEEISKIDRELTHAADAFSQKFGEASRMLENVLMLTLVFAVVTVEGTGLFLTISFSRNLTHVLKEMNKTANAVSDGDFNQQIPVRSKDELGQLANSMNQMIESLKNQMLAVNIRDEFMSVASHELKTPLTSLKLQAQMRKRLVERGEVSNLPLDKIKKMAEDDEHQVNRLIRLVDDMLDISRLRTGKFVIEKERVDLVMMIKAVLYRLEHQLGEARCEVTLDLPSEMEAYCDSYRLEQVVINLLTNAMKYGKGKPINIILTSTNNEISISVKDHGMGINDKDKERIFEQFERAIAPNEVSGLGLGLYIAKQIVDAHNGSIKVQSKFGEGATFIVSFPVKVPEMA